MSTLWVCGWVTLRGTWSINCTCSLPLLPTASHNKYKDSPFKISVFCTLQNPGSDLEGLYCTLRGRVGRDCRAVVSDSVRVRLQQRNELTAARVQSFQGPQGGRAFLVRNFKSAGISSNIWNGTYWDTYCVLHTLKIMALFSLNPSIASINVNIPPVFGSYVTFMPAWLVPEICSSCKKDKSRSMVI